MAQLEIKRLAAQLSAAQNGSAWHGPNLEKILNSVSATQAAAHPIPDAHSIWEIVLHMITWRQYALHKMEGDAEFDPDKDMALNFPAVPAATAENWAACQRALRKSAEELEKALLAHDDELLEQIVPGRTHNYYKLLHGIVQHDL